jgi:hypothetical protein
MHKLELKYNRTYENLLLQTGNGSYSYLLGTFDLTYSNCKGIRKALSGDLWRYFIQSRYVKAPYGYNNLCSWLNNRNLTIKW